MEKAVLIEVPRRDHRGEAALVGIYARRGRDLTTSVESAALAVELRSSAAEPPAQGVTTTGSPSPTPQCLTLALPRRGGVGRGATYAESPSSGSPGEVRNSDALPDADSTQVLRCARLALARIVETRAVVGRDASRSREDAAILGGRRRHPTDVDHGPKKDLYARLHIAEHFIFDPQTGELEGFGLDIRRGRHEEVRPDTRGRMKTSSLWMATRDSRTSRDQARRRDAGCIAAATRRFAAM